MENSNSYNGRDYSGCALTLRVALLRFGIHGCSPQYRTGLIYISGSNVYWAGIEKEPIDSFLSNGRNGKYSRDYSGYRPHPFGAACATLRHSSVFHTDIEPPNLFLGFECTLNRHKKRTNNGSFLFYGGEGGIRTLDRDKPIHAFQACAFGRSATSPVFKLWQFYTNPMLTGLNVWMHKYRKAQGCA